MSLFPLPHLPIPPSSFASDCLLALYFSLAPSVCLLHSHSHFMTLSLPITSESTFLSLSLHPSLSLAPATVETEKTRTAAPSARMIPDLGPGPGHPTGTGTTEGMYCTYCDCHSCLLSMSCAPGCTVDTMTRSHWNVRQ
jgi:hypothetical protein